MLGKVSLALAFAAGMGCGGEVDDRNVVTPTDLGVTGEACNQLESDGPEVVERAENGRPPAPTGGMIYDGNYHLASVTTFTSDGLTASAPSRRKARFEARGGRGRLSEWNDGAQWRRNIRYLPDFSQLVLEVTCGEGTRRIAGYEGTPSEFKLFLDEGGGVTRVEVYTREP